MNAYGFERKRSISQASVWGLGAAVGLLLFSAGCPHNGGGRTRNPGPNGKKDGHGKEQNNARDCGQGANDTIKLPDTVPELAEFAKANSRDVDDIGGLKKAVAAYEKALEKSPQRKDLLALGCWAACRVGVLSKSHKEAAKYGIQAARWAAQGAKLDPKSVEFPYYHAMGLAMKLQAKAKNALGQLPKVVELARRAIQLNPRFDRAGPLRFLGALYVKAPQVGSIGDPEKGIALLKKAVAMLPDSPLNRFFLAEGYFKDEQYGKAEKEFRFVINAPAEGQWKGYDRKWYRQRAKRYLEQIERKREGGFGM